MDKSQTILGPILNPRADGTVDYIEDGVLACNANGVITDVGARKDVASTLAPSRKSNGFILPPFVDAHIHIPQHPIRGQFMNDVGSNPPEGRLIAGLNKNVFPAEAKCASVDIAEEVVANFAADTLKKGVIGGCAYMTVHPDATDIALSRLSDFWRVGLVLMEQNCPDYLRVDPDRVDAQMKTLAEKFGQRFLVTDRFAVAVGSDLRRRASRLAKDLGLMTQTHLNEQLREKSLVEKSLYPHNASYADVYHRDGLLDVENILAHCIHCTQAELELLSDRQSLIAHCPTSNTLLGSGIMPLDDILGWDLYYVLCTDVGASPTTSLLNEVAQYLKVHAGRSKHATPSTALCQATYGPAAWLDLSAGTFEIGKPMTFIEVESSAHGPFNNADDAITRGLLGMQPHDHLRAAFDELQTGLLDAGPELELLDRDVRETAQRLEQKKIRVTIAGQQVV
jgi:guanine deaminase